MTAVLGMGWVDQTGYGCVRLGRHTAYSVGANARRCWAEGDILAPPPKNFGRFPPSARSTCVAGALALKDAGVDCAAEPKRDIAMIAAGPAGCQAANLEYFRDYVQSGRVLARGNLFIYTLPSSALAEAAIHFGCSGPLLYVTAGTGALSYALRSAANMIATRETTAGMIFQTEEERAVCFLLAPPGFSSENPLCALERACAAADAAAEQCDLVRRFTTMRAAE